MEQEEGTNDSNTVEASESEENAGGNGCITRIGVGIALREVALVCAVRIHGHNRLDIDNTGMAQNN